MKVLLPLLLLLALTALTTALPTTEIESIPTSTPYPPTGWTPQSPSTSTTPVKLVFALTSQTPRSDLESALLAVSDPESPTYGEHLSLAEVGARHGAPTHAIQSVILTLTSEFGIPRSAIHTTMGRGFITVSTTSEVASRILGSEYAVFEHKESSTRVLRLSSRSYSLPTVIAPFVSAVGPSLRFPAFPGSSSPFPTPLPSSASGGEGGGITPSVLRSLYKTEHVVNTAGSNGVGVASYDGQMYSPADLQAFFSHLSPSDVGRTPKVHGNNNPDQPGLEASLDIQYVMAMAANVSTEYWYTPGPQPGNKENEPFMTWLAAIDDLKDPAWVYSTSYGDNEGGVLLSYAESCNDAFIKLGIRGITLFFSSGDGGVGGSQPTQCTRFIPTFPAASPWVTAVGATASVPEVAASLSSGGFSNRWARKSWQDDAVKGYLSSGVQLPSQDLWNATGAAFPELSSQGVNVEIWYGGGTFPVSGTSCSSPVVAGIFSLLNGERIKAGKSPLGFLNPALYSKLGPGGGFNDITSGHNPGCNNPGFEAAKGWDPITGFGTINYPSLLSLVLSLP